MAFFDYKLYLLYAVQKIEKFLFIINFCVSYTAAKYNIAGK